MSIKHDDMCQNDVVTELLQVCQLEVSSIETLGDILNKEDLKANFLTSRLGASLKVEFKTSNLKIEWKILRADIHPFFENLPSKHNWEKSPLFLQIEEFLFMELFLNKAGSELIGKSMAHAMFIYIVRELSQIRPDFRTPIKSPPVFKAVQLIHSNPSYNWTVNELSKKVGLSRTSLYRAFSDAVGVAPYEYLKRWRVILAQQRLISEEDITLDILGIELGFSGQSAFSRSFKEVTHLSPKLWLKSHLRKNKYL